MRSATYATADGTTYEVGGGSGLLLVSSDSQGWEFGAGGLGFTRKARDIIAELTAIGTDAMARCDRMLERCAADLEAGTPGTLTVGEWSLACYLRRGTPKGLTSGWQGWDVDLYAPDPMWTRETTTSLLPGSGTAVSAETVDLPHDYPFDYGASVAAGATLVVPGPLPCDLRVTFYGYAVSPYVRVAGNTYQVNVTVPEGARLTIDPTRKASMAGDAIRLVGRYGDVQDVFSKRLRGAEGSGSYVFERVPPGDQAVTWPQAIGVDLTVIERRGSLPWTSF